MTLLPKVKLKTMPTFPSNVIGGTGLSASKTNGHVTLDYAWEEFGSISAIPTAPTSHILTWDSATNVYVMVPSNLLGGAVAGISDADSDNVLYGRKNAQWVPVPPPGTGSGGIPEADSDTFTYGRHMAAWTKVLPLGGGGMTGALTLNADPAVPLGAATKQYVDAHASGIPEANNDGEIYARKSLGWTASLPKTQPSILNYAAITAASIGAETFKPALLHLTNAITAGQYINLTRSGTTLFSIGYFPNSNIFGIGEGQPTDSAFNPSFRMIGSSAIALMGQVWSSFEVGQAENGTWFGTGTPNITYHSYAGEAVNGYFTQQMLQFTTVGDASRSETALTINVKNQTGRAGARTYDAKAAIQAVIYSAAGGGSAWVQANNAIAGPGWTATPGWSIYNTEIDTTNASGHDSNPYATGTQTSQINGLVIGGAPGANMISSYISIFSTLAPPWGAHIGISFSGGGTVGDFSIMDDCQSNTCIRLRNAHATGLDTYFGNWSFAQIYCKNFVVQPNGDHGTSPNLIAAHLDNQPALPRFAQLDTDDLQTAFSNCVFSSVPPLDTPHSLPEPALKFMNQNAMLAMLIKAVRELNKELKRKKDKDASDI